MSEKVQTDLPILCYRSSTKTQYCLEHKENYAIKQEIVQRVYVRHMARDVRSIGNAILDIAEHQGISLSNLALNKLIYFAHAWHLAIYSRPLVDSAFEAWQFGPVHPQVYRQLKRYGDGTITGRMTRIDLETGKDTPFEVELDSEELDHLEKMTRFYGVRSASWLVNATHEPGAPWDQVWSAAEEKPCPGMIIPDELTELFYRKKRERRM